MAFQMKVSKEAVQGKEVVPAGLYDVRFIKFNPKFSDPAKTGKPESLNLNAQMEIINHPDFAGRMVFEGLNQGAGWIQSDFCHAFGLPMETDGDGYWIPGTWDSGPDFDPKKAETYKYVGPLTGQTAKIELAVSSFNNKPNNKVRRYMCSVSDCSTKFPEVKHSQDLLAKRS